MAHIEKRAEKRYRVRYRDPAGRERSKTFHRLGEARRFKAAVEEAMGRGLWVDPRAGKTPLERVRFPYGAKAQPEPIDERADCRIHAQTDPARLLIPTLEQDRPTVRSRLGR